MDIYVDQLFLSGSKTKCHIGKCSDQFFLKNANCINFLVSITWFLQTDKQTYTYSGFLKIGWNL